ncbi:MAG: hypothetical protein IKJ44_00695 [Elusimicrobiaceae bacterium]|nr:hypothetical protein [Elusimicrobiaceae bacterium]
MNIAETLIGKNMKAHPEALGLYIGLDEMYVAQSSRKDGGIVLESLLRVPISSVDRTKLKPLELNDAFFSMDNWLDALTKVAAKKKWTDRKVVVSLSPAFSLLRHFVIPAVIERKHWKEAIPLQARKYIHFPFEKTMSSYHVYEFETAATKQKRLGVIFTITPKVIVERLEKGLKGLGLDPVAIETSPLSLSRAFCESDKEAVDDSGRIYSFFGNDLASFVFINHNVPVLMREVEIAGSLPVERRRLEITNCSEFVAKQLERDPFEEAVIMGVDMDDWTPLLEAESKKPVRKWDLREVYGIETKSSGELAAIGASMKFYDSKAPDLDFIKRNRLGEYEFNAGLMAWKIVGVVAVIVLFLIGKAWFSMNGTAQELKDVKRQNKTAIADFDGLTSSQIQSNLARIKTQNTNMETFLKMTPATPLLVDIVAAIPEQMWITELAYDEDFPATNGIRRQLRLEGVIQTGDEAKDLALGKTFVDKVKVQPAMEALCGNNPEVKYKELATGAKETKAKKGNVGEEASKVTSFTLTCGKGVARR